MHNRLFCKDNRLFMTAPIDTKLRARPTIRDLARYCGVSTSTVSRAINGKHEQFRIPAQTRDQILLAAKELGYSASSAARALAEQRTRQVGLLFRYSVPDLRGVLHEMLQELTFGLEAAGYSVLFVPLHGSDPQKVLREQRFDACVICDPIGEELRDVILQVALPTLLVNNVDESGCFDEIIPDDISGARMATRHLIAQGHRRIAFARMGREGVVDHFSIGHRIDGYTQAMHEAGLADHVMATNGPLEQFVERTELGRPGGYTAAVLYSHTEVVCLLRLLHPLGVRVPDAVSLVAFNDVFPMADLVPAITCVAVPAAEIGRSAARRLLERLADPGLPPRRFRLPETLVRRESDILIRST